MSEQWVYTRPVARKAHGCDACNRVIERGEQYRRSAGLGVEGGIARWVECAHCTAFLSLAPIVEWRYAEGYSDVDFHEFEPSTDDERTWHAQWKTGWRTTDGDLAPIPTKPPTAHGLSDPTGVTDCCHQAPADLPGDVFRVVGAPGYVTCTGVGR